MSTYDLKSHDVSILFGLFFYLIWSCIFIFIFLLFLFFCVFELLNSNWINLMWVSVKYQIIGRQLKFWSNYKGVSCNLLFFKRRKLFCQDMYFFSIYTNEVIFILDSLMLKRGDFCLSHVDISIFLLFQQPNEKWNKIQKEKMPIRKENPTQLSINQMNALQIEQKIKERK